MPDGFDPGEITELFVSLPEISEWPFWYDEGQLAGTVAELHEWLGLSVPLLERLLSLAEAEEEPRQLTDQERGAIRRQVEAELHPSIRLAGLLLDRVSLAEWREIADDSDMPER